MNKRQVKERIKKALLNGETSLDLNSKDQLTKITQSDFEEILPYLTDVKNQLKFIDLSNNLITELPQEFFELTLLETLHLYNNQIEKISNEFEKLTKLQNLFLSGNKITKIPSEICNLINLKILSLFNNQIKEIPFCLKNLQNLKELHLELNEELTKQIPVEILTDFKNPKKIINYYFKITEIETRPINQAKIVVIGEAGVGKTSLINRLLGKKPANTSPTHGIEIQQWEKVRVNSHDVNLNIWDFGGQELLHSTHQFFFTHRTIYVLVVDARENDNVNKVEEWIKRLESFIGTSPIIIIGNKIDQNDRNPLSKEIGYFDISRETLRNKYKKDIKFFGICSDDKDVNDELKKEKYAKLFEEFKDGLKAEIRELKDIHKPFPTTWFSVKTNLEEMHKKNTHYISYDSYLSNCVENQVIDDTSQTTIVEFLNEIGTVIYFKDLPEKVVFNPEWITNGVYSIVDNAMVIKNLGVFYKSDMRNLLNEEKYPVKDHKYILDIMRKFELCVDIEPDNKFLIPDALPLNDDIYTGDWQNSLHFQFCYETYIKSIFTKFVVRMFPFIYKNTYWRNGLVLNLKSSMALVKADGLENKIILKINGNDLKERQELFTMIRQEFYRIHETFTFQKPKELISHPTKTYKDHNGNDIPILKDYEELLGLEKNNIPVYVTELDELIPASEWLNGVSSKDEREKNKKKLAVNSWDIVYDNAYIKNQIEEKKEREVKELNDEVFSMEETKFNCDIQAKKITRYKLILISIPLIFIFLPVLFYSMWEFPEYRIIISIVTFLILIIAYILSAITLEEKTPAKFPEQLFKKEQKKQYVLWSVNLEKLENTKRILANEEHELKKLKSNNSQQI